MCMYKDFQQKVTDLPSSVYLSQIQQLLFDKFLCCQGNKTAIYGRNGEDNDLFTMSTLIRSEKCAILFIFKYL